MSQAASIQRTVIQPLDRLSRTILFKKLSALEDGCIEVVEEYANATGAQTLGAQRVSATGLNARVVFKNPRAFSKIVLGGSIGGGESYMAGDWECSDLTALMRIFVRNRSLLEDLDGSFTRLIAPAQKLYHRLRKNSIEGSKKNIQAHYDLGNDFFDLVLGSSWMYSSGYFLSPQSTLEDAQFEKNDRICRKLNLKPSDHLLEIGTGWGSFAIHAAKNYGCKVTTTTISRKQFELAKKRIAEHNLADRVTLLEKDYRLLEGQYDCIVSIEMIEAVGLNFLETYFEKCSSLLKPTGQMLLQGITIRDQFYESAKNNVDFIQRYIFPGSGIPSVGSITQAVAKRTDLEVVALETFGQHYARTLRLWSERMKSHHTEIKKLGYTEALYRMWLYYFSYCEGGFLESSINVMQMHLSKPMAKLHQDERVN